MFNSMELKTIYSLFLSISDYVFQKIMIWFIFIDVISTYVSEYHLRASDRKTGGGVRTAQGRRIEIMDKKKHI